jgi:predicted GIY-YIG superfamily endonuclease
MCMGISKRWSRAKRDKIGSVPANVGAYELAYNKRIVYIGSGSVRDRLQAHNASNVSFTHFRYEETNSRTRAIQRERKLLKEFQSANGRLPKYNDQIPNPPR